MMRTPASIALSLAVGLGLGFLGTRLWFAEDAPHEEDVSEEQHAEDAKDHGIVEVDEAWLARFRVELSDAGPGELVIEVALPGEVQINPDATAHVTPRVSGVAREVFKSIGEEVAAGELLAVLESRELAETKAEFLAAKERLLLSSANFEREGRLRERKISTEKEYLVARQEQAKAEIDLRSAEQRLLALGVTKKDLEGEDGVRYSNLTRYELRAPFDGVVIQKHITRGERISVEDIPFLIADLRKVWIKLTVFQKDLGTVRIGQEVTIGAGHDIPVASGKIDYISSVVDEATRCASARVVLPNTDGLWRPGLFVTGRVAIEKTKAKLVVPRSSILDIEGRASVFVRTGKGFELRPVKVGKADKDRVVVLEGLESGETYVSSGGFTLKAELNKKDFGGHGHGH